MGRPVSAKPRRHAITHRRLWSWTLRTLRAEAELALDGTVGGPLADALLADQVARHEARLLPERLCELGRRDDDPPPCGVRHPRRGTTEDPAADAPGQEDSVRGRALSARRHQDRQLPDAHQPRGQPHSDHRWLWRGLRSDHRPVRLGGGVPQRRRARGSAQGEQAARREALAVQAHASRLRPCFGARCVPQLCRIGDRAFRDRSLQRRAGSRDAPRVHGAGASTLRGGESWGWRGT
jgi:hypothetical protein